MGAFSPGPPANKDTREHTGPTDMCNSDYNSLCSTNCVAKGGAGLQTTLRTHDSDLY